MALDSWPWIPPSSTRTPEPSSPHKPSSPRALKPPEPSSPRALVPRFLNAHAHASTPHCAAHAMNSPTHHTFGLDVVISLMLNLFVLTTLLPTTTTKSYRGDQGY